ncbi:unnamed protein product, partial [Notodromas monacha]
SADVLDAVGIQREPIGVTTAIGRCPERPETVIDGVPFGVSPDQAYNLEEVAILSVPTSHLFPLGFPRDFSILATLKSSSSTESTLLTIYSDAGDDQISIRLRDSTVTFYYQDRNNSFKDGLTATFPIDVTDDA